MDPEEFLTRSKLQSNFIRIAQLVDSGVFGTKVLSVFQESVFTEIMIKLNDLLQKLKNLNSEIDFKEDIDSGNITDLVRRLRYAVCHTTSGEHVLDKENSISFSFCSIWGKAKAFSVNGKELASDYEDDVCFFYGENKIYFKRHLVRCIKEAQNKIKTIYPDLTL